jgi:hypothetical protein
MVEGKTVGTPTETTERVSFTSVLRVILCAGVFVFALTVAFHDYPGHDHFSFAHELLSQDAPVEKGDSDPEQEKVKSGLPQSIYHSLGADFSVQSGDTSVGAVFLQRGFGYLSSGRAPPAGGDIWTAFSFPAIALLFIFFIILQKPVVFEYTLAYIIRGFPLILSFEYEIVSKKENRVCNYI